MSTSDKAVAVVIAGDASDGCLSPVAGHPAIAHTVAAAAQAEHVAAVRIATSDEAVTAWAEAAGFDCVPDTGSPLVATAQLESGADEAGAEIVVAVDATAALLLPGDIDEVVDAISGGTADAATAIAELPDGFETLGAANDTVLASEVLAAARLDGGEEVAQVALPFDRLRRIESPSDRLIAEALLIERARQERLLRLPEKPAALIMDFDGVFTDNAVFVDQNGTETVRCNRSDGLGIDRLRATGLPLLVLSKEQNPVVAARCEKLQLECLQGLHEKRPALEQWCQDRRLDLMHVVYIGNDINDLTCFDAVGYTVAVADAWPEVLQAATIVLSRPGGAGALRELSDLILGRLETQK